MASVSVTELKARLSHFLRMARRGSEVQILERGVPVARLVGVAKARGADRARVEQLKERGILRQGTSDLRWLLTEAPVRCGSPDLAGALSADRDDRL